MRTHNADEYIVCVCTDKRTLFLPDCVSIQSDPRTGRKQSATYLLAPNKPVTTGTADKGHTSRLPGDTTQSKQQLKLLITNALMCRHAKSLLSGPAFCTADHSKCLARVSRCCCVLSPGSSHRCCTPPRNSIERTVASDRIANRTN